MAQRGELLREHLLVSLVVHQREVFLGEPNLEDAARKRHGVRLLKIGLHERAGLGRRGGEL